MYTIPFHQHTDAHVWAMIIQTCMWGHSLAYECLYGTLPKYTLNKLLHASPDFMV